MWAIIAFLDAAHGEASPPDNRTWDLQYAGKPRPDDILTEHKTPTNSDHCNHGKGWTVDCEECGRRAGGDVLSNIAVRVRIEMLEHAVFGRGAAAQLEPIDGCTEDAASCDCSWHENLKRAEETHRDPENLSESGIIRAAEGVVLEPGEYEVVEIAAWDDSPVHHVGERFTVHGRQTPGLNERGRFWVACSELRLPERTLVTAVRRVEPEQGERPIVVGSTWLFNGNEERVILALEPIEVGIPGPVRTPHGTWKDEALFRKLYTWASDPAPKAEPSADSEDMALAKSWRKAELEQYPIHGEHDPRSITERLDSASKLAVIQKLIDVVRQRDSALSRVAELEARQLNTDAGMNTLRKQHEELAAENAGLKKAAGRLLNSSNFRDFCAAHNELRSAIGELAAATPSPVDGGS